MTSDRERGVDAFRFGLAFLVVVLHTVPPVPMQIVTRAAVPFFLVTGGAFLAPERHTPWALIARPVRRLLPIHLFWLAADWTLLSLAGPVRVGWADLLTGGPAYHLWFLPALGGSLALVGGGIRVTGGRVTGVLCTVLAVAGLLRGGYHPLVAGLIPPGRGAALVAPWCVWLGWTLNRWRPTLSPARAGALVALALGALVGEEWLLATLSHQPLASHDFLLATPVFGVTTLLLARSLNNVAVVRRASALGQISLGVYTIHLPIVLGLSATPLDWLVRAALAFAVATAVIWSLSRVRPLTRFVT